MDLNVGDILNEIQRELNLNGTTITLQWNALPAGATPDPVDGSVSGLSPQTTTLQAFIHQVQAAGQSQVRQFNEVEVGDIILDLVPNAPIDGLRDLVFVMPNGKQYVAKQILEKLAQSWDVTIKGQQLMRTVLLRVKT